MPVDEGGAHRLGKVHWAEGRKAPLSWLWRDGAFRSAQRTLQRRRYPTPCSANSSLPQRSQQHLRLNLPHSAGPERQCAHDVWRDHDLDLLARPACTLAGRRGRALCRALLHHRAPGPAPRHQPQADARSHHHPARGDYPSAPGRAIVVDSALGRCCNCNNKFRLADGAASSSAYTRPASAHSQFCKLKQPYAPIYRR
jgi:hypothetical protein